MRDDEHYPDDDEVIPLSRWAAINSISLATARRLMARGDAPEMVQLSPYRIGITRRADREWKRRRVISPAA
jgi:hypothetical protein